MAASNDSPTQHATLSTQHSLSISPAQLTILVVCVVSVYFVIGFYGKSLESFRISQREEDVQREVRAIEARNRQLQERVTYLSTDSYVETAARDKLNLARPGDRSLIVLPEKPAVAWVDAPQAGADGARPFAEFGHLADWLALFFGRPGAVDSRR